MAIFELLYPIGPFAVGTSLEVGEKLGTALVYGGEGTGFCTMKMIGILIGACACAWGTFVLM